MKPRTKSDILNAINITFDKKEPNMLKLELLCYKDNPGIKISVDKIPYPARAFILAIAFYHKSFEAVRSAFTISEHPVIYDIIFGRMTAEDFRYTFDFIKTMITFEHL